MSDDQLSAIQQTLRQLVSGQEALAGRLDRHDERFDRIDGHLRTIDVRLDGMDDRLDKLEINYETMSHEMRLLAEAQVASQEAITRGFNDLREDFDRRIGPLETAVRRLYGVEG